MEVELREWQVDWAHKVDKILQTNNGYIDTSAMRSGKTYVTLWIAQQYNLKLLIICPLTTTSVWKTTAKKYGVEIIKTISYQSLRSTRNHQPKHNFLERMEGVNKRTEFVPTKKYLDLLEGGGILLVLDEIQNIKNNSSQYKACSALIHALNDASGNSRFALLSGTPLDKEEHAINLLKMIGYIRSRNLYRIDMKTKEMILEGLQDLINECARIDINATKRILKEFPPGRGQLDILCYKLYVGIIKNEISGAMKAPEIKSVFDVKNGFYSINKEDSEKLKKAVRALRFAVTTGREEKITETPEGIVEKSTKNVGGVITALLAIENAKAADMARVADKALTASKKGLKVVISVNYTSTIETINAILAKWNPLILNGKVKENKRDVIIKAFVEDPKCRVFIMNTVVGGVGISLYSEEKNQDRLMLISPSYRMIEIIQAASRIFGPGLQSKAEIRLFYGKCPECDERSILTALAKKSLVLKGTLDDSITVGLKLPGDYESFTE